MRGRFNAAMAAGCGLLAVLVGLGAQAMTAGATDAEASAPMQDSAAERARIDGERQVVQDRFEAARQACVTRFAVNACLDEAKSDRRHALEALRQRQARLDEVERRARASDKRAMLARRADAAASAASAHADAAPAVTTRRRTQGAASGPAGPAAAASAPLAAPASAPGRPAAPALSAASTDQATAHGHDTDLLQHEATRRQEFERRQEQARSHAAAVAQREALRKRPAAAPLPVPQPASR